MLTNLALLAADNGNAVSKNDLELVLICLAIVALVLVIVGRLHR